MFGNGFMVSWDILGGFVEDMSRKDGAGITGWGSLGSAIGEALNGAMRKIDFVSIANTIATGLNGAIETLTSLANAFDFLAAIRLPLVGKTCLLAMFIHPFELVL